MSDDSKNTGAQNDAGASAAGAAGDDTNKDGTGAAGASQGAAGAATTGTDDKASTATADTVSKADFEALMKRMQNADKRATTAENRLKKIDTDSLSDIEKAKQEAAESKAAALVSAESLKRERIFNSFLADSSVSWHDATAAFTLLMQSDTKDAVSISDEGKVEGMTAAVKAFAKSHAYLVKPAQTTEATGSAQNGNRKGTQAGDTDAEKQARARRFPAAYNVVN